MTIQIGGGGAAAPAGTVITPEQFGAVGDGTTDDWAALVAAITSIGTSVNGLGGWIELAPTRNYRCSKELHLNRGVTLLGKGPMPWYAGAKITFDAGVHGIIVDSGYLPVQHSGWGDFSNIQNIAIASAGTTHRDITDAVTTAASKTLTSATAAFTNADVGKALLCTDPWNAVSNPLRIPGGTSIASVTNATTVVMTEFAVASATGVNVRIGGGSGVTMAGKAKAQDVVIRGFVGHGLDVSAEVANTNANGWEAERVWIDLPGVDGIHAQGGDANAGIANVCMVNQAGRYGVLDVSGLGNTYVACQTSTCTLGGYRVGGQTVNTTTLVGCYSEGDQALNYFGQGTIVIGGVNMGVAAAGSAGVILAAVQGGGLGGGALFPFGVRNNAHAKKPYFNIGGNSASTALLASFGSDTDNHVYEVVYNDYGVGQFAFVEDYGGSAIAFTLSTELDPNGRGAGFLRLPKGYIMGTGTQRILNGAAAPTTGAWLVGDMVYNTAPASGGFIGWVCTVAGTPGTWKTFGLIS